MYRAIARAAALKAVDSGQPPLLLPAPPSPPEVKTGTEGDDSLTSGVRDAAKGAGFSAPRPVIEVRGTCGDCGDG